MQGHVPDRLRTNPRNIRAVAVLTEARGRSDDTGLVFRSPHGKPLSDMTLSNLGIVQAEADGCF